MGRDGRFDVVALRAQLAEVQGAGGCVHPVRLGGSRLDTATGALTEGQVAVACKDRRAAVCPSCSRRYQADAWHLAASGLAGGKGVPADVVTHPRLFVTLTAPSFGAVHRRSADPADRTPCRPRRSEDPCRHGRPGSCWRAHAPEDPSLGEPLCAACFDYDGAVRWNASVPALWRRTTVEVVRSLARIVGRSEAQVRREARLSFLKVVEFQRRGLVHVHVIVRADGPGGPHTAPPGWLDPDTLATAVEGAARRVAVPLAPATGSADGWARWGPELHVADLAASAADPEGVAAYVAKYSVKSADDAGRLAQAVTSRAKIARLGLRPHLERLVATAWDLGGSPDSPLRRHAHRFGYGGHFATKSAAYSTTFAALRQARTEFARSRDGTAVPAFEANWHFAGRGYRSDGAGRLAEALAAAEEAWVAERRRQRHQERGVGPRAGARE